MRGPIRLLGGSIKQFAIGLGPAFVMAFLCLAIQVGIAIVIHSAGNALFPPKPVEDFDLGKLLLQERDWRDMAAELMSHTLGLSFLFFFHALVALLLTAWLLRRYTKLDAARVSRRALRGAGLLTLAAAVIFAAGYALDHLLPATRYLRFDFSAVSLLAVWFGGTALILPARLMGHKPAAAEGFLKMTLTAMLVLVPWFYASEVLGAPLRHCRGCGGLFDGAIVFYPLLGAYLLGLTVSSAAVSAAACIPAERQPATP